MIAILCGCLKESGKEERAVKETIMKYNVLVSEGYRKLSMNPLQEVTTKDVASKLYFHMAALSEGKLQLNSTLKDIAYVKIEFPRQDEAAVETREKWDFSQIRMNTGTTYAEEKDFIYEMGYLLKKENDRWIIQNVNTISGRSTHTVKPWPKSDRDGNGAFAKISSAGGKPAGHP